MRRQADILDEPQDFHLQDPYLETIFPDDVRHLFIVEQPGAEAWGIEIGINQYNMRMLHAVTTFFQERFEYTTSLQTGAHLSIVQNRIAELMKQHNEQRQSISPVLMRHIIQSVAGPMTSLLDADNLHFEGVSHGTRTQAIIATNTIYALHNHRDEGVIFKIPKEGIKTPMKIIEEKIRTIEHGHEISRPSHHCSQNVPTASPARQK